LKKPNPWDDPESIDIAYNPEEWIIPAQDEHGHSSREVVRMLPVMDREMDILIQQKKFPYKTKSDLMRHAIMIHLRRLHVVDPSLETHFMVHLETAIQLLADDAVKSRTEDLFRDLEERIQHHQEAGDLGEAIRLAVIVRDKLKAAQDSAWKRRYIKRFHQRYGSLLNGEAGPV
jgi:hypothetical protein